MVQPASTLDVMARSGSIGSLVSQTVADAKRLLNAQAALASSELMQTGAAAATTGASTARAGMTYNSPCSAACWRRWPLR